MKDTLWRTTVPLIFVLSVLSLPATAQTPWGESLTVFGQPEVAQRTITSPDSDTLIPLGFSPHGHLATLTEFHAEEDMGYQWHLRLVDLRSDETVYEDSFRVKPGVTDRRALWGDRAAPFFKAMAAVGIPTPPLPPQDLRTAYAPIPLIVGSTVFTVEVAAEPKPSGESYGLNHEAVVALRSSVSGRKVIGRLPVSLDRGAWPTMPTAVGVWASPHEPRVAVLVLQVDWRMHGPPLGGRWTILGAHIADGFVAE